jgi:formate hydrogenlyase subunit 3/multisubunit Na+/H+ antiporter MnhD subunit
MPLTNARVALWALAGLLRIWAYPFHLSAPDGLSSVPASAPLFLGPVLGWALWIRLASANGGAIPDQGGVLVAAVFTMTVGGLLAWTDEHPRRALAWAGVSTSGSVLLAGRAAGQNAGDFIAAGGLSWALSMVVLLMCAGLMRAGLQRRRIWWGVPAWIGAAALVGLPLTLGLVTTAPLVGQFVREESIGGGVAFAVAQALLVPALVRWMLLPPISPLPAGRRSTVFWLVGLALPVLTLALVGVALSPALGGLAVPSLGSLMAMMTLPGWLLWAVALAAGGLLTWQESNLRSRMAHLLGVVHDLWRLEWLYTATSGAIDRGLSLLRAADDVVGGTGALLWSTVLFLILLLMWSA